MSQALPSLRRGSAKGHQRTNNAMRRIVISLDDDTFESIAARAYLYKTSFSEQARLMIEWGLEASCAY